MCLTQRKTVEITATKAYKIFTRDKQGLLQSTFVPAFKSGLKYAVNCRIRVDDEEASFFGLEQRRHAINIAMKGRRHWNMVRGDLIVLPVTMHEVVTTGKYHVPSGDPQCMDGYYPAFESKEIEIHDDMDTRNEFYDAVLSNHLELAQYSMSGIEKEAFKHRLPHLAGIFK